MSTDPLYHRGKTIYSILLLMSPEPGITGVKLFTLPMVSTKSSITGYQTIFTTCDVNQVKYHGVKPFSLPMVSAKSSISGGQTIFSTYDVNQVKYQWGSNHFLYLWCQQSQVSLGVEPFTLPMMSTKSSITGVNPFSLPMVSAKSSISGGQTIFSTYGVNQVKYQCGSNHFLYL